jgi:anti-sigma28 factor (negative regulator of flagellin synthesis)
MQIARIDGRGGVRAAGGASDDAAPSAISGLHAAGGHGSTDEVSLSESARSFAVARRLVASAPWVRESAVRSVFDAIDAGRYFVDRRDLATAIGRQLS